MIDNPNYPIKKVLDALHDRTFVINESGIILGSFGGESNNHLLSKQDLVGVKLTELFREKDKERVSRTLKDALCTDQFYNLTYAIDTDIINTHLGSARFHQPQWHDAMVRSIPVDHDTRHVLWTVRDLTTYFVENQTLITMLRSDSLTGALTRSSFKESVEQAMYRFKRYTEESSVLVIDIDKFKNINDQYGHRSGDNAIKSLVGVFDDVSREIDVIGRIGGDEFAVLLPKTNQDGGLGFAERLRASYEQKPICTHNGEEFYCSISIGVTELHHEDNSTNCPYERADEALYRAKQNGRNTISG